MEQIAAELRKYLTGGRHTLGLSRSSLFQGNGFLDEATSSLLSLETMGAPWIPGASQTWSQPGFGVEHVQVRPRSLASEPESGFGVCPADKIFCISWSPETVHNGKSTGSTEPPCYVIRMPGGVGGGNREVSPYPDWGRGTQRQP
jgi:hypothetical protein